MATMCTDPSYNTQENERNAKAMVTSCTNRAYRRQEQIADTNRIRSKRQTNPPEIRPQENERNAQTMATSCTDPAHIRSAKQDDNYGASNNVLPCPGS
jgi:hypothetical protein